MCEHSAGTPMQELCDQANSVSGKRISAEPLTSTSVTLVRGNQLGPDLVKAWRALQDSNADLYSPCFAPEFTQAVARVRHDVEVAVIEGEKGEIEAIFPFQRKYRTRAIPVGGIVSDYQGLICRADFVC